jgi:hypothetical protein
MTDYLSSARINLSKTNERILRIAAIVGAITVIAGGYTFYLNNVWRPKVEILSVDFNTGIAKIKYKGKEIDLEGDAVYWLNGDWGIKFGNIHKSNGDFYDRIELVKKGMVVEYLKNNQ